MSQERRSRLWNRNFTILWAGEVQSYLGDAFLAIGLMWLALEMTGSPAIGGTILALQGIPKLLGPLAGVIVDRANKRWLMIGSNLIRGMILMALFALHLVGWLEVWHLYLLVVILGALVIFYDPALRVMLPALVPDAALPAANSVLQASLQFSMVVGASLAGVALAAFGAPIALLLDGLSFLIAALALWFVHFPSALLRTSRLGVHQVLRDMVGGLRYILLTQEVLTLTILAFFINLVLSPVNVIFPVFSRDVLGGGVEGFGFLASAIAAGMLLGSVVAGVIGDRLSYARAILVGLLGMTAALGSLSFAQTLLLALLMAAGLGMMAPIIQVPLVTRLQRAVPKDYQGRVFATLNALVTVSVPLAAALAGHALVVLPVPPIFRVAALGTLIVAGIWAGVNARRPSEEARQPEPLEGSEGGGVGDPAGPSAQDAGQLLLSAHSDRLSPE